jgi:formyltetrahydrofolate-dependent phosphoribosylglycinamide formyltransferase
LTDFSAVLHIMFDNLQKKWKVNALQVFLIICTFAIGGSMTGYAGKKIMNWLQIERDVIWVLIYILLITIIWPLAVLIISIPFGQFRFFSKYIAKIGRRMGLGSKPAMTGKNDPVINIAIFASGAGTNAGNIIQYFSTSPPTGAKIALIVCNKPGAGVLKIAEQNNIPTMLVEKERFFNDGYLKELKQQHIEFIVLAGFLWKLPLALIRAYPKRIINIHPALLPNFGGRGMYGTHVHEAVLQNKKTESGITIHYVDEQYDNGDILLQVKCPVFDDDTPETLAHRIHELEYANYPVVIEELVSKLVKEVN